MLSEIKNNNFISDYKKNRIDINININFYFLIKMNQNLLFTYFIIIPNIKYGN